VVTLALCVTVFVHHDSYLMDILESRINLTKLISRVELFSSVHGNSGVPYVDAEELSMSVHLPSRHAGDQTNAGSDGSERDEPQHDYAMIELDARSITDSTHGLLYK
jgi:hypothetical protein